MALAEGVDSKTSFGLESHNAGVQLQQQIGPLNLGGEMTAVGNYY